jgi:hypothetical protein
VDRSIFDSMTPGWRALYQRARERNMESHNPTPCPTLCGTCNACDALVWALDDRQDCAAPDGVKREAWRLVHNLPGLADLLAGALRGRGVAVDDAQGGVVDSEARVGIYLASDEHAFTMPAARRALLRILKTTDAAGALEALTHDPR